MNNPIKKFILLILFIALGMLLVAALAQGSDVNDPIFRMNAVPGGTTLFNGWGCTPAGEEVPISDLPLKMILSPDGKTLLAVSGGFSNTGLTLISVADKKVTQFLPMKEAWNGLAFSKDGTRIFVSSGDKGEIHIFRYADGRAEDAGAVKPNPKAGSVFLAGIAVHPVTGRLYVCNEGNNEIWVLNPDTLALEAKIGVGQHPHSCALGADKRRLYVSNWGSSSVSVVDTQRNTRAWDISVGLRPNDLAMSPDGRLFVACSGDNTVHVIQTRMPQTSEEAPSRAKPIPEGTREILSTSLYPQSPEGSTPDSVAVSPDGKALFVANADNNDVMVADISGGSSAIGGFIPTGWYPSAVAVSADGNTLFVGNGKGKSRANFTKLTTDANGRAQPAFDYIARTYAGSVSFIAQPTVGEMKAYTEQVFANCPYRPEYMREAPIKSASVIPDQVGLPCPIKYVLYIIKENRTYDQVFGDFHDSSGKPAGNGDPRLTMYGESVTPNQHQLARDYILFDNLYCNGEVSMDGHSWCDAALATDYNERAWIMAYSSHGNLPGNDEMEDPAAGYLWDECRRNGLSFRVYGEGSNRVPSSDQGTWTGWSADTRDMDRVDGWIKDLHAAEETGNLPRFTIMSLGENHTMGTKPGAFTPEACVASNDIGVGKIVAAATRSKFWKDMAIFIVEDDSQDGPDHVDAHRTAGLVISPWCKRGIVDSTMYTQVSMVRTIELILGLPPLTQYDAGATPMFACFGNTEELTPFNVLTPSVDLYAKNLPTDPGAKESALMDFSDYDRAPEDQLNRVLWLAAKGPDIPYPPTVHCAVFLR